MHCSRPYPFLSRLGAVHSGRKALWPHRGPQASTRPQVEDLLRRRFAVGAIQAHTPPSVAACSEGALMWEQSTLDGYGHG
jgi:hypothetical protein